MNEATGTILVVDDERDARELLSRRLGKLGHKVLTAAGGAEALATVESSPVDLVLLDVVMPEMSGFEVLAAVRAQRSLVELPVIMITGQDDNDDVVRGLGLGANDYLTKPVSMPVVLARVRTQLILRRAVADLEKANRILEEVALIDALTGVANRRCFDQTMAGEWSTSQRTGTDLSLVMIDVDHFKHLNDRYGHEKGDTALRVIGAELVGCVRRATDLVARYGGEEFAVVLPHTPLEGARVLAERMRRAVEERLIALGPDDEPIHLTVSAGVASEVADPDRDSSVLLRAADARLYEAKRLGRNCVVAGGP